MNEALVITLISILVAAIIIIVIVISILVYNQMLLLNEVNKRLLLLTQESIEKERQTQEDLTEALRALDEATAGYKQPVVNEQPEEQEDIFDPHTYND